MSISDKELQEAFRRSQLVQKQNDPTTQKANALIRANVLAHNKAKTNGSDTERMLAALASHLRAYFASSTLRFTAVAFAIVAMLGVYNIGTFQSRHLASMQTAAHSVGIVHYHGFEGEDKLLAKNVNSDYQARFNAYTRQYIESSLVAKAVTQQPATLQSQDGYWLLVNCENQQVVVSESLIASLDINGRIEGDINVGTQVALAFDSQGRILSIKQSNKPLMC
ncbi:hypothetical protein D1814_17975 [Alteromonas sp. BL110]|uniref:hypothetical protein n=1 Tax=Alteromonas sp. BL110 TaxID=1714845 RepID=UPI000E504E57|nr:hypothetical protein [Alteromonas sp. BL110]AXT40437.1 hypothetical protein D1814_17975 [Alteromonas sp. BL110]RKM79670.1 hypothetical protein D7031_11970 [Alteromonas sp. BL110]